MLVELIKLAEAVPAINADTMLYGIISMLGGALVLSIKEFINQLHGKKSVDRNSRDDKMLELLTIINTNTESQTKEIRYMRKNAHAFNNTLFKHLIKTNDELPKDAGELDD